MNRTIWLINQYASTPETGIGGRHYYLARELAKQGHKVYLIAASYTHLLRHPVDTEIDYKVDPAGGFSVVWVRVAKYPGAHSKKRILNWFTFAWKLRGLKKISLPKPDAVLYSSPSLLGFLGAKHLARHYGARLAFEVRDIWPLTLCELGGFSPRHPFIRLLQWVEDKAYRDSDIVVSNLKNSVVHMTQRGMIESKFTWIANGFSLDEVSQKKNLSQNIDPFLDGKFIVGYTGTLGLANSLDSLVSAAEILKDRTEIIFCLVGDGREKKNLQRLVCDKKLANVRFLDAIPKVQIQSMLERFDVCFIGLTADPLFRFGVSPNKLFDYFYSAKPVIYAIESGAYRPVAESNSGIQVPPESPEAIADAIVKLYDMSKAERQILGDNGRRFAVENHEYGSLAKKLAQALFGAL